MSSKIFKLSSITLAVAASFGAHAAIYNVVEISESSSNAHGQGGYTTEYYGTAVEQGAGPDATLGCFGSTACTDSAFKIAAETRNWEEGISYREEAPFAMDNAFNYVDDQSDFESYCYAQLRYATCNTWAEDEWNGYAKEIANDFTNSIAFVEDQTEVSATNAVINSLNGTDPVGNKRDGSTRNVAFVGSSSLTTPTGSPTVVQTRAWKTDGTYTVGSVSRQQDTDGNGTHFYSKASIWDSSDVKEVDFGSGGDARDGNTLGQASIRDFKVDGTTFYGVGYNTYTDQRMDATVFVGDMDSDNNSTADSVSVWTFNINPVSNAQSGSDYIYSNSVVSSINDNFVAVGSAKRAGDKPQNRAASNRLFYVSDVKSSSPAATYFSGGIFFDGAGGTMGSINNFNEVVGSVDISSAAEIDGTERAKRAFINPLDATNTNSTRRSSIFDSKAWILDDLTNDGSASSVNNRYRIIDASDINDAGVIAATAIKCENGYDTTEVDSYCQGGAVGVEKVVAVKLVPIADSDKGNIQSRGYRTETVDRQGGSLGFLALTLLGFLGFRKK